jgi:hypothetical protein
MITASYLYSGMVDYWGGDGRRWDNDAGCLFASYGPGTTVRDLVDQWVDDFNMGGDCDSLPEDIGDADIRDALLEMLTPEGRADYDSGQVWEGSLDCEESEDEDDFTEWPVCIILIECEG